MHTCEPSKHTPPLNGHARDRAQQGRTTMLAQAPITSVSPQPTHCQWPVQGLVPKETSAHGSTGRLLDFNKEYPKLDLVCEGTFTYGRRHLHFLGGRGGVGKSSFAVTFGIHAAIGKPYLGTTFAKPLKIVYIDFEGMPDNLAKLKEEAINGIVTTDEERALAEENFKWCSFDGREKARENYLPGMHERLIDAIRDDAFDVIIIDSFERAFGTPPDDTEAVAKNLECLAILAEGTNAAVLVLDHTPKSDPTTLYGSAKKGDYARAVHMLLAEKAGLKICNAKATFNAQKEDIIIERIQTETTVAFREEKAALNGSPSNTMTVSLKQVDNRANDSKLQDIDKDACKVVEVVDKHPQGISKTDLAKQVAGKRQSEGFLRRFRRGKWEQLQELGYIRIDGLIYPAG